MAKQSTSLTTPNLPSINAANLVEADEDSMTLILGERGPTIVSTRYALAEWGGLYYLVE
jgi:hypothetical protein